MNRNFILFIIAVFFVPLLTKAQRTISNSFPDTAAISKRNACSNDIMLYNLRKDPVYKAREEAMNKAIRDAYRSINGDTIILPVVIHIIDQNPASVTDLDVLAGVQDLNDAFSKAGAYAASLGVDTKIRFCLSQKDPDGGNTTGITRTVSFFSDDLNMATEDSKLKDLIQWDPLRYINIWLIKQIHGEAYSDFRCGSWYRLGVGGYASLPPGGGVGDGIVITGFGKLLAHEMGHYLGLYHTFAGGCTNFDCLNDGDMVCDTPPDDDVRPSPSCAMPTNSCRTDTLSAHSNGSFPLDVPDQIANFMDYGNGGCSNMFSQGQSDRMRAAVMTQRSGLLIDECTRPCIENIVADFTRDIPYPLPTDLVTFTNNSTGAANYEWLVDGVVVATTTNFSYTFSTIGKTKVTLKAFNTPGCFASLTDYVIVTCGVTARFFPNKISIASTLNVYEDSTVFTNTSYNALTYQWIVSNDQGMAEQLISTNTDLTYVFPTPGNYFIKLIATNGTCIDSTVMQITVDDPRADGDPITLSMQCYQPNKVKLRFCITDYGYAPIAQGTPVSFYDGNPYSATANLLSPVYYLTSDAVGGNCTSCYTHILDVPYRGLETVYMVINDSGTVIPIALPNTPLQELNYFNNIIAVNTLRTYISASICQGQSYAGHTTAGVYVDTLVSNYNGCDSIRTLNLSIKPVFATTVTTSICQGQNYAGHTTTGTFVDLYHAVNGCDSTRTLHLTVKPTASATVNASVCQGQSYAGHTTTGTFVDVYNAANGCDSTRTLHLTVKPVFNTSINTSICQGDNYAGHTTSGTYVDVYTAANGCDSTRTLQLTVRPTVSTTITTSICQGQSYAGHTTTGTYVDVFTAVNGCDSTRTLNLTVRPTFATTVTTSICQGQNYAGHTATGTYVDVYPAVNGCDSTRTLHLTVKPTSTTSFNVTICEGQSNAGHTVSGTYVEVFTAANGCDSTRTLNLTVNPRKFTTVNVSICQGQSYLAGGHQQTTTGVYIDSAHTYLGCDSIITTNLTVKPLPSPHLGPDKIMCIGDVLIFDPGPFTSYLWQDGNTDPTYQASFIGDYSVTVKNIFGCKASDTVKLLNIYLLPADFLPPDTSLCRGNKLFLNIKKYDSYAWSTGSTASFAELIKSGKYWLQVKDDKGCFGKDSINVLFYDCKNIQVPNAFTPNGDGENDVFKPLIPAPVSNYRMQIWNAWGELVFETRNYLQGWDGTYKSARQSIGTFIYLISLTDIDGKNVKKQGSLVLIR